MNPARSIPEDQCPFKLKHVTLGRVADGNITYAQGMADKRQMLTQALADFKFAGVIYFVAWTGKYATDIFEVTEANVAWMVGELGGKIR